MTATTDVHETAAAIVRDLILTEGLLPSTIFTAAAGRVLDAEPAAIEPSLRELESSEPAAAQRALRIANGAFFGTAKRARSLVEAADIVGAAVVSASVVTASVFGTFDVRRPTGVHLEQFTSFALQVGRLAHEFGRDHAAGSEAFAAGTLLDVGKLALALRHPTRFLSAVESAVAEGRYLHDVERDHFGVGHPVVGAELLRVWGLPAPVLVVVEHHHAPRSAAAPAASLAYAHAADALLGIITCRAPETALDVALLEELGLTGQLDGWRARAREAASRVLR